ncbi:MAG: hypothetical protein QXV31_00485, partial [Zestosphaera sp.]
YDSVADAVNFSVLKSVFEGKISVLTPLEGQTCIARCLKGLNWEELSQELNYPPSKAASILRKAVEKLSDLLPALKGEGFGEGV